MAGEITDYQNMMAVRGLDTSDAAAYVLLKRIAEKAAEPMDTGSDPNKTLGECRKELTDLLFEAVQFVATRNAER
jgi:antitoxin component of RelBE/YafQ-DinJ toxin-antitoxin module